MSCSKAKEDIIEGGNGDGTVNEEDIDNSFQGNSKDVSYDKSVVIVFNAAADTAIITNSMSSSGVSVTEKNGYVTVTSTSTEEVSYVVSGTINGGGLKIYSDTKFNLILNGTNIVSSDGAAVNIQSKKKCTVTLIDGTNNRLVDGRTYTETDEDMKGTLFSEGQIVFSGNGALLVKGNVKHAICSDDYISVTSGSITVSSAAKDAVHAKDYVDVSGGILTLTSSNDCIEAEEGYFQQSSGSIVANATADGGKGVKATTDIILKGGNLTVNATGNGYYDATENDITSPACIKCDGNLEISGSPTVNLAATGKAGKGINVDGTLTIDGGVLNVSTSGAKYAYNASVSSSAKAVKADGIITINSGTITIKTTQDGSEGLESKSKIYINGGTIEINAYDDCINASSYIEINGGKVYCWATNNDGIDSNGTMTINGGTVVSYGTNTPEEGLDCDNNTFTINGGTVIGIGGASSTPTASVSNQPSLLYGTTSSAISSYLRIEDASGNEVVTFKVGRTYSANLTFCITSPNLKQSTSYLIYTGGSVSGGTDFHGLYSGATYTKGTQLTSFTASSMVTTVGTTGGGGGGVPGGRP